MGHSKNMFVDEGGALKREQKQMGRGCTSMYVCSYFFLKKNAGILKMKFYYSTVFPIDYNGSMKYHHERL